MTTAERAGVEPARKPDGPVAALMWAAGVGILTLGILTTINEFGGAISSFLNFYNPVGPLAGKTTYAVVVFLIAWVVLHNMWKNRDGLFGSASRGLLVLALVGFLMTFPVFFQLFAAG